MGIKVSHAPEDWGEDDWAAIREALKALANTRGYFGFLDEWAHYDEYEALFIELRVSARLKAKEVDKPTWVIWSTYRRRPWRDSEGVTDGFFDLSDWDRRVFRRAWAIAKAKYPEDEDKQRETAEVIALEVGTPRRRDAWATYNYEQLSLFDESDMDHTTGLAKERYEMIPDPTPTGADPQDHYQWSFLDSVLETNELPERAKLVAEMLAVGEDGKRSYQEIADTLGVSKATISNDVAKIKLFGEGFFELGEDWYLKQRTEADEYDRNT